MKMNLNRTDRLVANVMTTTVQPQTADGFVFHGKHVRRIHRVNSSVHVKRDKHNYMNRLRAIRLPPA